MTAAPDPRVLFLAFYYPPLGGGGVQRTLKFAKYLPDEGFEPWVVTGPDAEGRRHAPLDASMAGEGSADEHVFRCAGPLPLEAPRAADRWLARPTAFATAWEAACEETAERVCHEHGADVLVASMSPFSTCGAAERVASRMEIPWIADLRDPWALDEMSAYPSRWHRGIALRRMRRALSTAARVVMNTPDSARALAEAFPELSSRTLAITNGFDAEDFAGAPPDPPDRDRLRIVHTGALHVGLGLAHARRERARRLLGGERVPVDILARSHVHLLRALERWQQADPEAVAKVDVVLAGDLSQADQDAVRESPVAERFTLTGYLSHAESVALLRGADLLFLPMHGLPAGERARIVPGKTYEYLAARRPILAAVPEGDARDFVQESGLGEVCDPTDVDGIGAILRRRMAAKQAGERTAPAPDAFYARFERRTLTRRLAALLREVIAAA